MKVSLVMAVYNGEEFLKEALGAAISQTYSNLEIIVVNDGSTDSTKAILDAVTDSKVKVIHLKENQGAANAMNTGISQATGDWIAVQDADDNSFPTRIEEQVKHIQKNPRLVGLGTFIECIPGSPTVSQARLRRFAREKNSCVSSTQIRKAVYHGCPLTHSSVMFCKEVFFQVGGYSTDFRIAYDYDLWLKLLEKGEIENLPKVLLQYRIRNDSLSHNNNSLATVTEVQIASSRAVGRLLSRDKDYWPNVIVIGPQESCEHYRDRVAPFCKLKIAAFAGEYHNKQIAAAVKQFKQGKAESIILLDGYKKEPILNYLAENGLVLNKHVFNLYNFYFAGPQRFYYREMTKGVAQKHQQVR
ncbi:glycosyltransferase family 2 protein [Dethiobacter alkaliphilus]|uniref:Glycosyl transferase family 2 n=1 Tax=Dethiobacter alkaliphilus AHT 1 TaxID=555088 RepID=C0GHH9_DETAL|nr:glycosyltransferase [Dethiobacter alkaliphilus]EEG77185.1 glycosyl transferase family 2 [Dethiobacter alkaliphilus AHT 1]